MPSPVPPSVQLPYPSAAAQSPTESMSVQPTHSPNQADVSFAQALYQVPKPICTQLPQVLVAMPIQHVVVPPPSCDSMRPHKTPSPYPTNHSEQEPSSPICVT